MERQNILRYESKVKNDGRIDLQDVSRNEMGTVRAIAEDIMKWDGITGNLKVKGTDGRTSTTLSIVSSDGSGAPISVIDWCKKFHVAGNLRYNAIIDTTVIGELRVEINKQSAIEIPDPPKHRTSSRIPVHDKISARTYIRDDDDDDDDEAEKIKTRFSRKRRPYIPK